MSPQDALIRLGQYCLNGTGIVSGGYPRPSNKPNLPAIAVFWVGIDGGDANRITYRGGVQELLVRADVHLYVADQNEAGKVVSEGDALVVKLVDRFRNDPSNPAHTLGAWGNDGLVKHCHLLTPVETSQILSGWGASFYGAVLPFEIKISRIAEAIP